MLVPEFIRSERLGDARDHIVIDDYAGSEAGDVDAFFSQVGEDGCVGGDLRGEILDVGGGDGGGSAVRFFHAEMEKLDLFIGSAVAEDEFAELLDAGLVLHAGAELLFAFAGAVVFKADSG